MHFTELTKGQRGFLLFGLLFWPLVVSLIIGLLILLLEELYRWLPVPYPIQDNLRDYLVVGSSSGLLWPLYIIFIATPVIIVFKRRGLFAALCCYVTSPLWGGALWFALMMLFLTHQFYLFDGPVNPVKSLRGALHVATQIICVGSVNVCSFLLMYHFLRKKHNWPDTELLSGNEKENKEKINRMDTETVNQDSRDRPAMPRCRQAFVLLWAIILSIFLWSLVSLGVLWVVGTYFDAGYKEEFPYIYDLAFSLLASLKFLAIPQLLAIITAYLAHCYYHIRMSLIIYACVYFLLSLVILMPLVVDDLFYLGALVSITFLFTAGAARIYRLFS